MSIVRGVETTKCFKQKRMRELAHNTNYLYIIALSDCHTEACSLREANMHLLSQHNS